jgi:hypothetical protein
MRTLSLVALVLLLLPLTARAQIFEFFAKGSFSKNNIDDAGDEYQTTVSATAGIAITLIPRVRIEGRYTNVTSIQNKLVAPVGSSNVILSSILTQTSILSLGMDVDLCGDKYAIQPYVYLGGGYDMTSRSYYVQADSTQPANYVHEPNDNQLSANLGAGLRIHVAQALALEVEAFAYGLNFNNPNPLVNVYGSAGIRIFL